jgi:hypothetical protein
VLVIALAGDLPAQRAAPLSRSSRADLTRLIRAHPDAPPLSPSSIWRLLDQHLLTPWPPQGWIVPRDAPFLANAGRVLDRYAGGWAGEPWPADD